MSDGHQYAAAGRVSESLLALSRRFGETLQENRIRLTESRLSHLAPPHSPNTGRVLLHKAYGETVASLQSVDVESFDPAVRWGEYQLNRALLQAISREHPEIQQLVRDARQHARYRRQMTKMDTIRNALDKERWAIRNFREAASQTRAADEAFRQSLQAWYVDPDAAREVFYQMSREQSPKEACQEMQHNSTAFGRRRMRGRFQKLEKPAWLGERAARLRLSLPEYAPRESDLGRRFRQLRSGLPEEPGRSKAELGRVLRGLTKPEMKVVQQVLGTSTVRELESAHIFFQDRESGLGL